MAGYQKYSDTWRNENTPKTLAGLATLAGVGGRFAQGGETAQGGAKVAKVAPAEGAKAGYPPAKVAKVAKVSVQCNEPTAAYRAASAEPDGNGCTVEIVELPQAGRYRKTFAFLQLKPPALVDVARWRQCVADGSSFLARWGEQAEALGWTSADLFGLHHPPAKPHPSYNRLSRYDCTGLCWLLQGKEVIAITADSATIRNPRTGNVTVFRKNNRPAYGPLGDSLDDFK
jgi:hypothetical protein